MAAELVFHLVLATSFVDGMTPAFYVNPTGRRISQFDTV
jgi:hypothetical protein